MKTSARAPAVAVGLVGLAAGIAALGYRVGFPTDPLGPRAFPLLAAGLLVGAAAAWWRRPEPPPDWPEPTTLRRQGLLALVLLAWSAAVDPLGFALATPPALTGLAVAFRARLLPAAALAVAITLGLMGLFGWVLGTPFPPGALFRPGPG